MEEALTGLLVAGDELSQDRGVSLVCPLQVSRALLGEQFSELLGIGF